MTPHTTSQPATGLLLLRLPPRAGYKGVDREPFEPLILEEELDPSATWDVADDEIWRLYAPGWRRDAYRLFEEQCPTSSLENVHLLPNLKVARKIKDMIPDTEGQYEILRCVVYPEELLATGSVHASESSLGFDVAYPGGDYYSAVLNGLLVNPAPELVRRYATNLNESRLFSQPEIIGRFLADFRRCLPSEASSEFAAFELSLPHE